MNTNSTHSSDEDVLKAARAIFTVFKPANMVNADFDNSAILGAGDEFRKQCVAAARAAAQVGANGAADIRTWQDRRDDDILLNGEAQADPLAYAAYEIADLRARLTAGATASTGPDQQAYCTMNCSRKEACADCAPPAKDQK